MSKRQIRDDAPSVARVCHPAPEIKCTSLQPDGIFKEFNLSDHKGRYVVLFFYPLDFTFVCPTEIAAFNDVADQLAALKCDLVGCSVDSEFVHLAWTNTPRNQGGIGKLKFPLLADVRHKICQDYGVEKDADGDEGVALRATFIISDKGIVRHAEIADLPIGRNPEETVRLVQAFQFADEHGQVCPASWRPGKATMKPDPKGSQEYFKTLPQ